MPGRWEMSEDQLYEAIRQLAGHLGLLLYHTRDSRRSHAGFPDLVVVGPGGVLFRELKRDGAKPTAEQHHWLTELSCAGADAAAWRPGDLPNRVPTELRALRPRGFTCPRCRRTSYHPEDRRQGYCGACHDFTGIPAPDGAQP